MTADVRSFDVADEALTAAFIGLTTEVYAADAWYLPTAPERVRASLARPEFADRQRLFLAGSGEAPISRAAARVSPTLRDGNQRPLGMIGFFAAHNDASAATAVLREAAAWLRRAGCGQIVGPMDGDTWHPYRVNIGPFEAPPFFLEPHNPPYYAALWACAGFAPLERYYSSQVTDVAGVAARFAPFQRRCRRQGFTFRCLRMDAFAEQLNQIYALTCAIFRDNFLYTPISPAAFSSLYAGIEQLVDPDLVRFATDARGELVGFVFAMPDWQETLCARRRGATAAAPATINIKTLGVLPRVRGSGLAPALMHGVYAEAAARGMKAVNLCLIREGNPSGRLEGGYGRRLREYILYGLEA